MPRGTDCADQCGLCDVSCVDSPLPRAQIRCWGSWTKDKGFLSLFHLNPSHAKVLLSTSPRLAGGTRQGPPSVPKQQLAVTLAWPGAAQDCSGAAFLGSHSIPYPPDRFGWGEVAQARIPKKSGPAVPEKAEQLREHLDVLRFLPFPSVPAGHSPSCPCPHQPFPSCVSPSWGFITSFTVTKPTKPTPFPQNCCCGGAARMRLKL